jgi:hypothetical protein
MEMVRISVVILRKLKHAYYITILQHPVTLCGCGVGSHGRNHFTEFDSLCLGMAKHQLSHTGTRVIQLPNGIRTEHIHGCTVKVK